MFLILRVNCPFKNFKSNEQDLFSHFNHLKRAVISVTVCNLLFVLNKPPLQWSSNEGLKARVMDSVCLN